MQKRLRFFFILFLILFMFSGVFSVSGCDLQTENKVLPISTKEVYEIMTEKKDYTILDVRTREEFDEGHLEGAVLIPVDDLETRIGEISMEKPVIVYCRSGRRSAKGADILLKNGFRPVYDMQGGIEKWVSDEYPIFKTGDEDGAQETEITSFKMITMQEVAEIVKGNAEGYVIMDVRSEEEYVKVHIKGAVSVPVSEFEDRLGEFSLDIPVIVYCTSSSCSSSSSAARILVEKGFKTVFAMDSGIGEWLEAGYPTE
jgi:rhodanese-related sulfurtransferase